MNVHPPAERLELDGPAPRSLACLFVEGAGPTLVWLGGYRSDMRGTKAERIEAFARGNGLANLRFDYRGHGESSGRFEDGTISQWTEDALAAIEAKTSGPLILVGSSMGAWIALRLAALLQGRGDAGRLAGMLLLAPAPDFTNRLVEPSLTPQECIALEREGVVSRPSQYSDEPTIYTRALLEDGAAAAVMKGPIDTACPVRIIQGMNDPDVPHGHALELLSHLPGEGVTLTLVADGDHRLSREEDLKRMEAALRELVAEARDAA